MDYTVASEGQDRIESFTEPRFESGSCRPAGRSHAVADGETETTVCGLALPPDGLLFRFPGISFLGWLPNKCPDCTQSVDDDIAVLLWLDELGHAYAAPDILDFPDSRLYVWVNTDGSGGAIARVRRSLTRLEGASLVRNVVGDGGFTADQRALDIGYQLTDLGRESVQQLKRR